LKITLISGGARSGKSRLAQEMASETGDKVLFVATAEAGDDEMRERIEAHKRSRPSHWITLEIATGIGRRISENIGDIKTVIIDCITLLLNNIFERDEGELNAARLEKAVITEIEELLECINRSDARFIIVTNELGLGLVPPDKASRLYRDYLGRANQMLAARADEVYFMVAGIPLAVK
jgi:adenosylcobinamide kinase/adenosylcobinamide-phosphate guanylyltransferase